eukprot:CAMPEP_0185025228 /NCGR_PEP_ID=MMETSP1103-20130426/8267_1 /TAXON_ID=36769 /ORGANISM="Paraphysomonas bandaiensis, Strain Caron Lab Isolate" /LENGTH=317 /DNA_ID=CAMNT_0027558379 /DNA_START=22 /DNA_END=975 /DNA_ORIENTATION=+
MLYILFYSLLLTLPLSECAKVFPAPSSARKDESSGRQLDSSLVKAKPAPIIRQLANFNDLKFHEHNRFYAKTLSYGQSITISDLGPFQVVFSCTDASVSFNVTVSNSNSFPISYHGTFAKGAVDQASAHILPAGSSVNLLFAEWTAGAGTGNDVGTDGTGAILTSNGYYLGLANSDSFLLSVSNDDTDDAMPESDCTVAGFLQYAHPHGGGHYDGLLSESLGLGSSGTHAVVMFSGVFIGMIMGGVVLAGVTMLLVKNRSLFLHSIGYYESPIGACLGDESWRDTTACLGTSSCFNDTQGSDDSGSDRGNTSTTNSI